MYDPVPDLAALIDGLGELAAGVPGSFARRLGDLYSGPYARLRGGLLLDEPGLAHVSTEDAIREALDEARHPQPAPSAIVHEEASYAFIESDHAQDGPPRDLPVTDATTATVSYMRLVNHYAKFWPEERVKAVRERLLELARDLPAAERGRMPVWLLTAMGVPEPEPGK